MSHESLPPSPAMLPFPAWAHAAGLISLREASAPGNAAALADRMLFIERIARYCWAYDERRPEALASCFVENAVWEGSVSGRVPIGPFRGRNRIVEWLEGFWPHQHDQRRHMILNTIVEEQAADSALTLSYLLLMSTSTATPRIETCGFYSVKYHRVDGSWLIEHLTAGFDAPFWPGNLNTMSAAGRARHGIAQPDAV